MAQTYSEYGSRNIPAPTQCNSSIDEYFKMIKTYAIALRVDINNKEIKEKFFIGLSPENKINTIRFGINEPINKIVNHLNRISTGPTDIQKFRFGDLRQGDDSIMEYYTKVKKCNESVGYNEDHLKHRFFHGLSPDNQIEARICGLDLSLDELVGRLSAIEDIRKNQSDVIWVSI
nr:15898_t:CDS:1 [Entrophospora candida]